MVRPIGQARRLTQLYDIFDDGPNYCYMLYDPVANPLHVKCGLSETGRAKRFVGYNINPEGIRLMAVFVIKTRERLYEAEKKLKAFAEQTGQRILTNRCRQTPEWMEWFSFPNPRAVYDLQEKFIKWLQDQKLLMRRNGGGMSQALTEEHKETDLRARGPTSRSPTRNGGRPRLGGGDRDT